MPNPKPIEARDVPAVPGSPYPESFAPPAKDSHCRRLGNHFALTQFGVSLNTLGPRDQSGLRHWHSLDDEFIYVLEGELTLRVNDGEFRLLPGMCMGFRAQDRNAHLLLNCGDTVAHYLIVGSRVPGDTAFYPDDDLAWFVTEDGTVAVHKDGTPYP
jgi:uncharacterized cupin superfamily protein